MLFRGSGFRRSQKKVCKGHRHGALWGSMRPSRPPRWLVQIPRLSGGLCFLARKSSLASNDPSHGTLMPTRTLSWGSSILIKGGENTPPLGLFSLGKREALPRDAMDQTDPLGQGGFSKATLPPARRPTRHSSRAIVPPKWTLPWASNKHSNLHFPYPSWTGRGSLSIPEGAWQKPPSIWMLESQEKLLVGPKECHGRGQLTPGITSGRGGKVDLENSTCMPTVPSPDPPALGGGVLFANLTVCSVRFD